MNWNDRGRVLMRATLVLVCLLPVACGRAGIKVHPVSGEVFFNDKPATGAVVHFHPLDKAKCPAAFGTVDEEGSYQLSTFATFDGAAAGDYLVTVSWLTAKEVDGETVFGNDRLGQRYSKPEGSKLKATVEPGDNTIERFNLK